jgi:GNAT superfamily N-acetyltransferase
MPGNDIRITTVSTAGDHAQAAALLHDFVEWMRTTAGFDPLIVQPAFAAELSSLRAYYSDRRRSLWLAYVGGVAVGTIALHRHDDGTAELKRMYVRPVARGLGAADRLIDAAVRQAADWGCDRIWLETLRGPMDRAAAVYRRHGFTVRADTGWTLPLDTAYVMQREVAAHARP